MLRALLWGGFGWSKGLQGSGLLGSRFCGWGLGGLGSWVLGVPRPNPLRRNLIFLISKSLAGKKTDIGWALVKGFHLSYHNKETIVFTIDPQYGNLNKNPLARTGLRA